jgi:eukaryotic-like serine/threonine-protein kinase
MDAGQSLATQIDCAAMTPEQWQQVKALFHEATELAPEARAAFIEQSCHGDAELAGELRLLLESHDEAQNFIEQPAVSPVSDILPPGEIDPWKDKTIGQYRVLSEIGRGGMGLVLLAVRADDQFRQNVAIKVLRRGMDTDDILRRFRNERQILASLNHPNIANLYDGGTTPDGLPYFVMEHVEGLRLLQYVDEHDLSVNERLELFRKICTAVQHAHQNLIIHRDLKPNNILVTHGGEVKLLDFGVAKLVNPELAGGMTETQANLRVMTPEYASPEQVLGQHVTTATDIYSLGVILYELLTGVRPYELKDTSPAELSRAICHSEPSKPSDAVVSGHWSVVSGKEQSTKRQAQRVGSSDGRLTSDDGRKVIPQSAIRNPKFLRGDLDNIVLKALKKEPARRYLSVEQFSEDIRRHLEGLPVIARKDTFGYRAGKFVRRHKVGVAATLLIMLALVAGIVATVQQARVARLERDKAKRINTFLQDMLGAATPQSKGVDVKVVDVLEEASRRAKTELADQPEIMGDVLLTLGVTYISLGRYDLAEPDLRVGLNASLKANGEPHPTTATTMGWLGLALAYLNKAQEGEQISRRAVELQRRLHPGGHEDLGVALYSLGANLLTKGEAKTAVPFLEEAEVKIKQYLGEAHGYHLATLGMLGRAREQSGDAGGAESLYRQAIDIGRRVEYRYRIYLAQALGYLGVLLIKKGNYSEAESAMRESIDIYREQLGDSNYSIGVGQKELGSLYFLQGDYAKAEQEYKEGLVHLQKYLGREHPVSVSAIVGLGVTLTRAGKPQQGQIYLREALEIRKKLLPPGDVQISVTESALGECLTAQKRYREAETLLTNGYEGLKAKLGEQDQRTIEARQRLAKLYEAWHKPEMAARFGAG